VRLTRLHIHHVRNVQDAALTFHPQWNFFWGENGSGKTSLLESIHLLALGRSFRSHSVQSIITYHQPALACFGEAMDGEGSHWQMGIEKNREGEMQCKISGEVCRRLSQFASLLPVQLITPESLKLLSAGPAERRQFLDWGVFHVEHSVAHYQQYQRLLKQRNAALKTSQPLVIWEKDLALTGEAITQAREAYLLALLPWIERHLSYLLPDVSVSFHYEKGWEEGVSLSQALQKTLSIDARCGHTTMGPHRAELKIEVVGFPAHQLLSRGQQKLVVIALQLAQAQHLRETQHKSCLFLLDEMGAELDALNRQKTLPLLMKDHQVFLTGTDPHLIDSSLQEREDGKMFHVEHGQVKGGGEHSERGINAIPLPHSTKRKRRSSVENMVK